LTQRTLLITGILLMVAGFLLGGVVGPIVDQASPTANAAQVNPQLPRHGRFGPGFPGKGHGYGHYRVVPAPFPGQIPGRIPGRIPRPTPSPNA
jgi:hypothetical protein